MCGTTVYAFSATRLRSARSARNGVVSRSGLPSEVASERSDSMVISTTLRGFSWVAAPVRRVPLTSSAGDRAGRSADARSDSIRPEPSSSPMSRARLRANAPPPVKLGTAAATTRTSPVATASSERRRRPLATATERGSRTAPTPGSHRPRDECPRYRSRYTRAGPRIAYAATATSSQTLADEVSLAAMLRVASGSCRVIRRPPASRIEPLLR